MFFGWFTLRMFMFSFGRKIHNFFIQKRIVFTSAFLRRHKMKLYLSLKATPPPPQMTYCGHTFCAFNIKINYEPLDRKASICTDKSSFIISRWTFRSVVDLSVKCHADHVRHATCDTERSHLWQYRLSWKFHLVGSPGDIWIRTF